MTAFTFNIDRSLRLTACCLGLGLGLLSGNAYADCTFQTGSSYMTYERDMGTFWVPRDAAVGTVIGTSSMTRPNNEGASVSCGWNPASPHRQGCPTPRQSSLAPCHP